MAISNPKELKEYYKNKDVVQKYVSIRFSTGVGCLKHNKQLGSVNELIRKSDFGQILEVAPGPARLTKDIDLPCDSVAVAMDYSAEMLKLARDILEACGKDAMWLLINGDAFSMPFMNESFDFVYSFRLIRHFRQHDRERIYTEFRRVLRPNGFLMFDAQNYNISYPHRLKEGLDDYPIYDRLYVWDELIKELTENGWHNIQLKPVLTAFNFQMAFDRIGRRLRIPHLIRYSLLKFIEWLHRKNLESSEWVVICQKR